MVLDARFLELRQEPQLFRYSRYFSETICVEYSSKPTAPQFRRKGISKLIIRFLPMDQGDHASTNISIRVESRMKCVLCGDN